MPKVRADCYLRLRNREGDKNNIKIANVYYDSEQLLHPIATASYSKEELENYDVSTSFVDLMVDTFNERFFDIDSYEKLAELFARHSMIGSKTQFIITSVKE